MTLLDCEPGMVVECFCKRLEDGNYKWCPARIVRVGKAKITVEATVAEGEMKRISVYPMDLRLKKGSP